MVLESDLKSDAQVNDGLPSSEEDFVVDSQEATAHDRRDMMRLGKAQEMKVCNSPVYWYKALIPHSRLTPTAEFSFDLHLGLFDDCTVIMGSRTHVSALWMWIM